MRKGFICESCGRLHVDPTVQTEALVKHWGFFLCGMANEPHKKENFVRSTIIIEGKRVHLITKQEVR